MREVKLVGFMLIQFIWTAISFEQRSTNRIFGPNSRFTPSFRTNRLVFSRIGGCRDGLNSGDESMSGYEERRRQFLLGSATILGSAILGFQSKPAGAATVILEESEARRIDMFERNSPSVVFIDTFTEKQDQFSPNVMEVPLGSGSGFIWDKDGHIGRYFAKPPFSRFQTDVYHTVISFAIFFSDQLPCHPKCKGCPSSNHYTDQKGKYYEWDKSSTPSSGIEWSNDGRSDCRPTDSDAGELR